MRIKNHGNNKEGSNTALSKFIWLKPMEIDYLNHLMNTVLDCVSVLSSHYAVASCGARLASQSCYQIEISPEFGSFSGAFLGTFEKKTKKFFGILEKFGSFLGAFLGAFHKYVEILCYFGSFFNVLVSFGSFLGRF